MPRVLECRIEQDSVACRAELEARIREVWRNRSDDVILTPQKQNGDHYKIVEIYRPASRHRGSLHLTLAINSDDVRIADIEKFRLAYGSTWWRKPENSGASVSRRPSSTSSSAKTPPLTRSHSCESFETTGLRDLSPCTFDVA